MEVNNLVLNCKILKLQDAIETIDCDDSADDEVVGDETTALHNRIEMLLYNLVFNYTQH